MIDSAITRRRALAGIGGVGVGALSGCAGFLGGGDGGYPQWLAAPSEMTGEDAYRFAAVDAAAFWNNESDWERDGERASESPVPRAEAVGIDPRSVERSITCGPGTTVLDGSFDTADVEARFSGGDFLEAGEHQGYALYSGTGTTVAVGDVVIVSEAAANGGPGKVRLAIDAKRGAIDRYTDESEALSRIVEEIGDGVVRYGVTYPGDENVFPPPAGEDTLAGGSAWRLADGTWTLVFAQLVATETTRDSERVSRWAGAMAPDEESRELSVDGRLVRVEVSYDSVSIGTVSMA